MSINEDFLDEICEAIYAFDCKVLFCGFTIISKDLTEFLCINAFSCKGADCFQEIYTHALNIDRPYWMEFGPNLFKSIQETGLTFGYAQNAEICTFDATDLSTCTDETQVWTSYPGWALFKGFRDKFKAQLCAEKAPYHRYDFPQEVIMNGPDEKIDLTITDKKELAKAIAAHLIENEFACNTFWYPFIVYLSVLLVKMSKAPYCATAGDNCC